MLWFATGGGRRPRAAELAMLPYLSGPALRAQWRLAREGVRALVTVEAFDVLEQALEVGPALTFTAWPRELLALVRPDMVEGSATSPAAAARR